MTCAPFCIPQLIWPNTLFQYGTVSKPAQKWFRIVGGYWSRRHIHAVCFSNKSHIFHRVACPKYGHPALSSEFYIYALHTYFVADVKWYKKIKSLFERWNNCKTNSPFTILAFFSRAKIKNLTWKVTSNSLCLNW